MIKVNLVNHVVIVEGENIDILYQRGYGSKRFKKLNEFDDYSFNHNKNSFELDSSNNGIIGKFSKLNDKNEEDLDILDHYPDSKLSKNENIIEVNNCRNIHDNGNCSSTSKNNVVRLLDLNNNISHSFDDFTMTLSSEEGFYLCSKGLIEIYERNRSSAIGLFDLWNIFVNKNKSFPIKYRTFEYFRDRCYIVKDGLNYGVDYSVYRTLPNWCHSEICLLVVDSTNESMESPLSWRQISSLTRVMPDVMKTLCVCYVTKISNSIVTDINSYNCLSDLLVRPVVVYNRRHSTINESYLSVKQIQNQYSSISVLKHPRKEIVVKKRQHKVKQSHLDKDRTKKNSRHNSIWKNLKSINSTIDSNIISNSKLEINVGDVDNSINLPNKKHIKQIILSNEEKKRKREEKTLITVALAKAAVEAANKKLEENKNIQLQLANNVD